ncbi:MAG: hypothetical protein ACRDN0_18525, partial [Trebonia sp.]
MEFREVDVGEQVVHRIIDLALWHIVAGAGRVPGLVNSPVQLRLALLERLQSQDRVGHDVGPVPGDV